MKIVVTDGESWLNDMHELDLDRMVWSPVHAGGQLPSKRSCPSWCKEGSYVYMFGGFDGVHRMNDFFACNLDMYTWLEMPCSGALPSPRYFHSSAVFANKMYVFGGYNGSERLADMYEYDFETHVWSPIEGRYEGVERLLLGKVVPGVCGPYRV